MAFIGVKDCNVTPLSWERVEPFNLFLKMHNIAYFKKLSKIKIQWNLDYNEGLRISAKYVRSRDLLFCYSLSGAKNIVRYNVYDLISALFSKGPETFRARRQVVKSKPVE